MESKEQLSPAERAALIEEILDDMQKLGMFENGKGDATPTKERTAKS